MRRSRSQEPELRISEDQAVPWPICERSTPQFGLWEVEKSSEDRARKSVHRRPSRSPSKLQSSLLVVVHFDPARKRATTPPPLLPQRRTAHKSRLRRPRLETH